ncbi:hypothetical protein GCM10027162_70830 [Streptomyces incanus]
MRGGSALSGGSLLRVAPFRGHVPDPALRGPARFRTDRPAGLTGGLVEGDVPMGRHRKPTC